MSASWSRRGGGITHPIKAFKRTLFELHSGRQVPELPTKLLLDEISPNYQSTPVTEYANSEEIVAALGPIGLEYTVDPQHKHGKIDLSFLGDPILLDQNKGLAIKRAKSAEETFRNSRIENTPKIHLKDVLIKYLRHVDPILKYQARYKNTNSAEDQLGKALLIVLNKDNKRYLKRGGRDVRDLMNWSWILTSETTERAAKRLWAVVAHQGLTNSRNRWSIPLFVFNLLLRRRNYNAEALRSLLMYAWKLMEKSLELSNSKLAERALTNGPPLETYIIKHPEDHYAGIKEKIFVIMIIRLLRSARNVLPAAYDSIMALTTRYVDGLNFNKGASETSKLTSEDKARLTYLYNTLLKLVSLPASIGPFQSAFHQQQAQFTLLRRMNKFQPPLIVDRRGYRAVVTLQLRHKKTLKEREWAQMKAKSWPPWKEEKLGIDAFIGVEHGVSRAMQALRRSWEAGYAPDNWDAAASVLSGWDTDRSPTIQTREIHLPNERRGKGLWASRVRATRTLDEAWSCFLSYKDQEPSLVGASWVYREMFEKIAQDAKRTAPEDANSASNNYADEQKPLHGDGLEVSAAPESPREALYVRIPPPTKDEFFEMMAKEKIRFGEYFLNTMFRYARTLDIGLQYLEASTVPDAQKRLLRDRKPPSTPEDHAVLESISPYIFASFIRLLTRFAPEMPQKCEPNQFTPVQIGAAMEITTEETNLTQPDSLQTPSDLARCSELASSPGRVIRNPLREAIVLTLARKPRYRPPWNSLLRALSLRRVVLDTVSSPIDQDYQDIKTWEATCHLLNEMLHIDLNLDLEGFHLLCTGLEKSVFASARLSRSSDSRQGNKYPSNDLKSYVDQVLSTGVPLLKEIFKDIVRSRSMQQEIPAPLMEEKSRIDEEAERQYSSETDDIEEHIEYKSSTESEAFLPPGCVLPRLLETPHPACLHAFVRVLGHCRDYDGLLDLVEWMSLFADELNAVIDASANGKRLMRRCITAIQVFLKRSWISLEQREAQTCGKDPSTVRAESEMKAEPAPAGIVKAVQEIIMYHQAWGGRPTSDEVVDYCMNGKFM